MSTILIERHLNCSPIKTSSETKDKINVDRSRRPKPFNVRRSVSDDALPDLRPSIPRVDYRAGTGLGGVLLPSIARPSRDQQTALNDAKKSSTAVIDRLVRNESSSCPDLQRVSAERRLICPPILPPPSQYRVAPPLRNGDHAEIAKPVWNSPSSCLQRDHCQQQHRTCIVNSSQSTHPKVYELAR